MNRNQHRARKGVPSGRERFPIGLSYWASNELGFVHDGRAYAASAYIRSQAHAAIRSSREGVPVACCTPKRNRWACAGGTKYHCTCIKSGLGEHAPAIKADGEN